MTIIFRWSWTSPDGMMIPVQEGTANAEYGTTYNWIDMLRNVHGGYMHLPRFERNIIFADPEHNQWNMGVTPDDIVDKVKRALVENRGPVHVIYNHNMYWHAVDIMGFDDNADTSGCPYTERFRARMPERVAEYEKLLQEATTEADKEYYTKRVLRARGDLEKIERSYAEHGGCNSKGVFYIRDSIYPDERPNAPRYDYELGKTGDEEPYAAPIVIKEFAWLRHFANHITQPLPILD